MKNLQTSSHCFNPDLTTVTFFYFLDAFYPVLPIQPDLQQNNKTLFCYFYMARPDTDELLNAMRKIELNSIRRYVITDGLIPKAVKRIS